MKRMTLTADCSSDKHMFPHVIQVTIKREDNVHTIDWNKVFPGMKDVTIVASKGLVVVVFLGATSRVYEYKYEEVT